MNASKAICSVVVAIATALSVTAVSTPLSAATANSTPNQWCGCYHCSSAEHNGMLCMQFHQQNPQVQIVLVNNPGIGIPGMNQPAMGVNLSGVWRTSPGDESWTIGAGVPDGMGGYQYPFTYQGVLISGSGYLTYRPASNQIWGQVTTRGSDPFGNGIPVGSQASGVIYSNNSFALTGWQLDGSVKTLQFYR